MISTMQKLEVTAENVDELVEQHADEWWTAKEIYAHFAYITTQMVQVASKYDEIRRRPCTTSRAVNEYNVGDAILARHRRRRVRPFLRKMIDGVEHFRCNGACEQWKPRDGFYANTVPTQHGLLTNCKACHLAAGKESMLRPMARQLATENSRKRRARLQEQVRKSAAFKPKTTVDAQRVIDLLNERLPHMTESDICRSAGVHMDLVRKTRLRAAAGKDVKLSVVDSLFTGLGWTSELAAFSAECDEGRPPWHKDFAYCQMCFRSDKTYMARGLCSTCYKHRDNPDYRPMSDASWAMRYSHCVVCGTTERRHVAHGRCGMCDARWRNGKVGSGHGNERVVQQEAEAADDGGGGRDDPRRVTSHA